MKKFLLITIVTITTGFIILSNDPLNDIINFVIGGTIPGTKIALGFWPTIGILLILCIVLLKSISAVRLQILEHTANEIKSNNTQSKYNKTSDDYDQDIKLRNAILGRYELESSNLN